MRILFLHCVSWTCNLYYSHVHLILYVICIHPVGLCPKCIFYITGIARCVPVRRSSCSTSFPSFLEASSRCISWAWASGRTFWPFSFFSFFCWDSVVWFCLLLTLLSQPDISAALYTLYLNVQRCHLLDVFCPGGSVPLCWSSLQQSQLLKADLFDTMGR